MNTKKKWFSTLEDKYGEPLNRHMRSPKPLFLHKYSPYEKYSQWVVEFQDCCVVITLYTQDVYDTWTTCFLQYDLYSRSEMEELLVEYVNQLDKEQQERLHFLQVVEEQKVTDF